MNALAGVSDPEQKRKIIGRGFVNVFQEEAWLNEQIKECDVLLPLIGIARPAYYITRPLWTFELDFEQNLKMVRKCAEYGKRVIFPSTSEVSGMPDPNNKVMG